MFSTLTFILSYFFICKGPKYELDMSPVRWQMPIHLLDGIYFAELSRISVSFKQSVRAEGILLRIKQCVSQGYDIRALQRNPHIVLLNDEWYDVELKPILAEWLFMYIQSQHISGGLSESEILEYLLNTVTSTHTSGLAEKVERLVEVVSHKKLLNLGKDWLNVYLPHVLKKINRVSFGLLNAADYERAIKTDPHMPRTRAKLSIPFVGM